MAKVCSFHNATADPPESEHTDEARQWLQAHSDPGWADRRCAILDSAVAGDTTELIKLRASDEPTAVVDGVVFMDSELEGPKGKFRIRTFRPESLSGDSGPVGVYLHGGGWVQCSIETHNNTASLFSRAMGIEVISVGYSLSPEASPDVIFAEIGIVWSAIAPGRFRILCGDSSGGNLVGGFTNLRSDKPNAIIMLYPAVDLSGKHYFSYDRFDGYHLPVKVMRGFIRTYLPDETDRSKPQFSVINGDLTTFPDALIICSQFDSVRDEARAFAEKLRENGRYVRYRCIEGAIHGFFAKGLKYAIDIAEEEIKEFFKTVYH
jgi:acetyl esterase/lipase